jgi:hypothetical protein
MTAWIIGLVLLVAAAIGGVVWKVAQDLATDEVRGWLPHLSEQLVRRAALRLPEDQRDRVEEWLAELAEYRDRRLTMLVVAFRIWRDRERIAKEARLAARAEAGSVGQRRVRNLSSAIAASVAAAASASQLRGSRVLARARNSLFPEVVAGLVTGMVTTAILAVALETALTRSWALPIIATVVAVPLGFALVRRFR